MQKIAILGATGRMGQTLVKMVAASPDHSLTGASTEMGHSLLGQDAGRSAGLDSMGVPLTSDAGKAVTDCDVAIDFTLPAATADNIAACIEQGCGLVMGTTGLEDHHLELLRSAAASIRIVSARNMSVGISMLTGFARQAARAMGSDADIEIIEAHHRDKIDAPSGTALQLGEAIANELGTQLNDIAVFDRHGANTARQAGSIGFSSVRAGSIVGDHSILMATGEEILEITHRALDRGAFARGALRAASWLEGQQAGLYSMNDVLGL